LLYLPPYSPDLNPIEQAFAKLKALLRKASARTVDDLWAAIAEIIELFPQEECANYFRNSGYPKSGSIFWRTFEVDQSADSQAEAIVRHLLPISTT
jgi:hypothetical protein